MCTGIVCIGQVALQTKLRPSAGSSNKDSVRGPPFCHVQTNRQKNQKKSKTKNIECQNEIDKLFSSPDRRCDRLHNSRLCIRSWTLGVGCRLRPYPAVYVTGDIPHHWARNRKIHSRWNVKSRILHGWVPWQNVEHVRELAAKDWEGPVLLYCVCVHITVRECPQFVCECSSGYLEVWTKLDGWKCGRMDGQMNRWVGGENGEWTESWMSECAMEWVGWWFKVQVDRWMDEELKNGAPLGHTQILG